MLTKTVDIHEAQTRFTELLSWVTTGTEVILTDGSKRVARLAPMATPTLPRLPGLHTGAIWVSEDFDKPLPDEFWTGEA